MNAYHAEGEQAVTKAIDECNVRISNGARADDIIADLHDEGFSIIATMKIVRKVYGVGLGQAKSMVTTHPSWQLETDKMAALSKELIDSIERDGQI